MRLILQCLEPSATLSRMIITLTAFRALSRLYVTRILRFVTIVFIITAVLCCAVIAVLASVFSPWWWLLLTPIVGCVVAFVILRTILGVILHLMYPEPVTNDQAATLSQLIDKLGRLFEIRNLHPATVALISIKDFVLYRELRTLKQLIEDSRTLKNDFKTVNDAFNNKL